MPALPPIAPAPPTIASTLPLIASPETLSELLHRVFGHREFRPHQRAVCEAAAAGRDVLLVMPTGAGKSLCYQLPALARGGTALVISPLIALMDDQATKLSALGCRVARIHSGLGRDTARQACRDYLAGDLDFLFIAPERMRVPGFPEMLARRKPALIAIDEAHCISAWGHDFRPDYRTLGQHLPALRPAPIIALTATATPAVQRDIVKQLDLHKPAVFITGFRRTNLAVEVVELSKPQRPDFALKLLNDTSARPAIIYAGSRKQAEELAETLHKHFPTAAYHAGLDPATRDRVQRAFLGGKLDAVVATVAFGMGVDKADVRTVIHVALPGSVEAFYQEIGRAGRDGLPSRTVLLHGFADRRLQEFFLEKNYPPLSELERVALALPTDFTPVDVLHNLLRKKRDPIDRETLDRSLEKLLAAGVALMDMAGDVRSTGETRWQSGYESQVAVRRAQIDRMVAFAESTTCRMAALIQHFGDTTDTAQTCGLCDICNPGAGDSAQAALPPTNQQRAWLREILSALDRRSTSTGKLFTDLHLLKDRKDFDALLDGLARAGLITLANDTFRTPEGIDRTYKKATITHEGRTPDDATLDTVWLRGAIAGPTGTSTKATSTKKKSSKNDSTAQAVELNPAAEAMFETLRAWRTEVARPTKTPAFMILSDAVLRSIARAAPRTISELNAISGMGPAKVDKYGAGLIAITRGTAPSTNQQPSPGLSPSKPATEERQRREPLQPGAHPQVQAPIDAQRAASPTPKSASSAMGTSDNQVPQGFSLGSHNSRERVGALAPTPQTSAVQQHKHPGTPPPPPPLTASQLVLEDRLKAWRLDEARKAGLPSFFIFSDTVLRNIVIAGIASIDGLRGVRGVAAEKVDKFGATILHICQPEP